MAMLGAVKVEDCLAPPLIEEQVQRIVKSATFLRCSRMRRFLQYTVDETLSGRGGLLKEYSIALNVYDKPATFDPRFDSLIRVEGSRLRAKLEHYYDLEGRRDAVLVWFPKGTYEPQFRTLSPWLRTASRSATLDAEAQRLYLRGLYLWSQEDPKCIELAIQCFSDALVREPCCAPALAALAGSYASLAWLEHLPPVQAWSKAELLARRALKESGSLAEAVTVLACENALFRWRWDAAESQFREVIGRQERYATAHQWYAIFCLVPVGRLDEAELELRRACDLDPASSIVRSHLARVLYFKREYGKAIEQFHRAIELNPKLFLARWGLGMAYAQMGAWTEGRKAFSAAEAISDLPMGLSGLGLLEALAGNRDHAEELLSKMRELAVTRYVSPLNFSVVEAALGRFDDAFDHLVACRDSRATRLAYLKLDPAFDRLKTHDKFLSLLTAIQV